MLIHGREGGARKARKEIFITGQTNENLDRVFSRYTKASRETTKKQEGGKICLSYF